MMTQVQAERATDGDRVVYAGRAYQVAYTDRRRRTFALVYVDVVPRLGDPALVTVRWDEPRLSVWPTAESTDADEEGAA